MTAPVLEWIDNRALLSEFVVANYEGRLGSPRAPFKVEQPSSCNEWDIRSLGFEERPNDRSNAFSKGMGSEVFS